MARKESPNKRSSSESSGKLGGVEQLRDFSLLKFVTSVWDGTDAWRSSRSWGGIVWFSPALIVMIVFFAMLIWGALQTDEKLAMQYSRLAIDVAPIGATANSADAEGDSPSAESEDSPDASASDEKDDAVQFTRYGDLLYRRILQLQPKNKNAQYYIALMREASGNTQQALTMMEELAPLDADRNGFEPAHQWMAMYQIRKELAGKPVDRDELMRHMEIASNWEMANPALLIFYANQLENDKKRPLAIAVARKAASKEPRYYLEVARMCQLAGSSATANAAAKAAVSNVSIRLNTDQETDADRLAVAGAQAILGDLNAASQTIRDAIKPGKDNRQLKRGLSDLYIDQYRFAFRRVDGGVKANLPLLNVAALIDPTNPQVGIEVARLANAGLRADEKTLKALQMQLASGEAAPLTHLLIANVYAIRDDRVKAIQHWELALAQNPNLVLALNNLASTIIEGDSPDFARATQLIDRALGILPGNHELLDTRGVILLKSGKTIEAIAQFEAVLSIKPDRLDTRESLIVAYQKLGMTTEAELASKMLEEKRTELEERRAQLEEEQKRKQADLEKQKADAKAAEATEAVSDSSDDENGADPKLETPVDGSIEENESGPLDITKDGSQKN
jgi:tetratricopeptide (TPR) repeat protein